MPKVSVVVPVYNVEEYLEECLLSILNQTLSDIEVICVDDGSVDRSADILKEYAKKDNRIKIITQQNGKQGKARNAGVEISSGEYIGFVDSDDYIQANFYETLYNAAKKHNADIACTNIYRKRKTLGSYKIKYEKEEVFENIEDKMSAAYVPSYNYVWNKIYKKDALIKSGVKFVEGMFFEDIEYTIKVLYYLNKMVTVPNTGYIYRESNVSTVKKLVCDKKQDDLVKAKTSMINFAQSNGIKIDKKFRLIKKSEIKLFGIKILKIYYWKNEAEYKLFGCIPFIKRRDTI